MASGAWTHWRPWPRSNFAPPAIKGNAPAIRLVIEISQTLDREIAAQAAAHEAAQAADAHGSDVDLARWIAFVLATHQKNKKRKKVAASGSRPSSIEIAMFSAGMLTGLGST